MTTRRSLFQQLRPILVAAAAVALTTLALTPTITGGHWFAKSLLAIATVAVFGAISRLLSLPAWATICVQGVALVMLLTMLYARDAALFSVLPGPDAWRTFIDLAQDGNLVITDEVAPVTATAGIEFLVVTGVGFIAWSVDAIAISGRRAALAGIPLLALYLVPATVLPDGVPWPLFLAAGVGWLLLLLEDGRVELSRWGRLVDGRDEGIASGKVHSIGGTGRRLGAAALTVAVIVPVILPSLDDGRFGGGSGDTDAGSGGEDASASPVPQVVTVNPIADLQRNLSRQDDSPVLFYSTDAITPQYFRIATLDQFNGLTWTLEEMAAGSEQQASAGLPAPPGLADQVARTTVMYDIRVGALDTPRLPLPYPPVQVQINGDWRWDEQTLDVFSATEASAVAQEYTVTALEVAPTIAQLQAAPPVDPAVDSALAPWLIIPEGTEDRLGPLATTITANQTTDYDRALALQNWFRTEFSYSLDTVEGNATNALEEFLRDRSGYCEQFAATMALMARALDIPSRVQVGFTPGEQVDDGSWVVTVHDAHAWPELWFEGVGWVRFEPTPGGGDGGAVPGWAPVPPSQIDRPGNRPTEGGNTFKLRRGPSSGPGGRPPELREVLRANRALQAGGSGGAAAEPSSNSTLLLWLLLLAVTGAAASAPKVAVLAVRGGRWRNAHSVDDAVLAAWADVLDAATDVDLRPMSTETPRDLAQRIPQRGGLKSPRVADFAQLAAMVERLRYRGTADSALSIAELRQLADGIRNDLFSAISARDRRHAKWWPTSGRIAIADRWNSASDHLGLRWQRWTGRKSPEGAASH